MPVPSLPIETERGTRVGVYVGADGDRPTRSMDALAHEIDPGVTSTIHRHSWDAMVLVVAGRGWTEIDWSLPQPESGTDRKIIIHPEKITT